MTNDTDQLESNDPRKTLDSIQKFERIGLQRGIPPLWFEITIAVLGGLSCALAGLGVSRLYLGPLFLLMVLLVVYQVLRARVIVKPLLSTRALIRFVIGTAVFIMPVILLARANLETFGVWLALSLGVIIVIAGTLASIYERRAYLKRFEAEKNQ